MKLCLPRRLYDEIKRHALEELPRECCGIVATDYSDPPHAMRVFRASNVAVDPKNAYRVDPDDQLFITREIEVCGLRLGAVYHSHPNDLSYPSSGDTEDAYPAVHLIVGMNGRLETRAWRFDLGLANEVELELT